MAKTSYSCTYVVLIVCVVLSMGIVCFPEEEDFIWDGHLTLEGVYRPHTLHTQGTINNISHSNPRFVAVAFLYLFASFAFKKKRICWEKKSHLIQYTLKCGVKGMGPLDEHHTHLLNLRA